MSRYVCIVCLVLSCLRSDTQTHRTAKLMNDNNRVGKGKKGKGLPGTGHEGPEGV